MDALHALEGDPATIRGSEWPGDLSSLDKPGLYSWSVDAEGAAGLSFGIGSEVREGRIYAGQTGATKWPSGKAGARLSQVELDITIYEGEFGAVPSGSR